MRLLSAIHPSTNQCRVLARIVAAPTASVAAAEISKNANLVAARNMLMNLGVIQFADGEAVLTDRGTQIASDENIIDQMGQLTDKGKRLAFSHDGSQIGDQMNQPPGEDISLESFVLLKELFR